jgi:hypothetical protein
LLIEVRLEQNLSRLPADFMGEVMVPYPLPLTLSIDTDLNPYFPGAA